MTGGIRFVGIQLTYRFWRLPFSAVYRNFERKADGSLDTVIGYLFSIISWDNYLVNLLPVGVEGIIVVLRNSCDQAYTYEINGPEV